jgi:hypothetical protein
MGYFFCQAAISSRDQVAFMTSDRCRRRSRIWIAGGDSMLDREETSNYLGGYFLDGLFADIDSLKIHAGIRGDHQHGYDSVMLS